MEHTYKDLHDTSDATEVADHIEAGDVFRRQLKQVRRAMDYEARCLERRNSELTQLRYSDVPPPTRQIAGNLYISDLKQKAEKPGEDGLAAQRCLNSLYSALSFYLPQGDLPQGRYAQVAASYELSLLIRDDNAVVWYNLACLRAQLGQKNEAVKALEKALEHGFSNAELMASDADLDPLRKRDDFKALMAKISTS
jgi:tetratricopeptide (TPR) repeat protein